VQFTAHRVRPVGCTHPISCGFTRLRRLSRTPHARRLSRNPGRERFFRPGRNGEFDRLFHRPTAYSAHTCHTRHAQERNKYGKYGKYGEYGKYVPSMRPIKFASARRQDDRLERADLVDPDGVHKDGMSAWDGRNRRKYAERSQFR